MQKSSTVHVGLDVHKGSIDIATADPDCGGEVRHVGRIGGAGDRGMTSWLL